jgi:hypothetical protein
VKATRLAFSPDDAHNAAVTPDRIVQIAAVG